VGFLSGGPGRFGRYRPAIDSIHIGDSAARNIDGLGFSR
jgi:hypothetical protein